MMMHRIALVKEPTDLAAIMLIIHLQICKTQLFQKIRKELCKYNCNHRLNYSINMGITSRLK